MKRIEINNAIITLAKERDVESFEMLFNAFQDFFKDFYSLVSFVPQNIYFEITHEVFVELLNKYDDKVEPFDLFINKKFKNGFYRKLPDYFNEHLDIIDNYLKQFSSGNKLNALSDFLKKCSYREDIDTTLTILSNSIDVCDEISTLVSTISTLNDEEINKLCNSDSMLVHLVKMYALMNDLDVQEEEIVNGNLDDMGTEVSAINYYMYELKNSNLRLLTKDEELDLGRRISQGDEEAENLLFVSNLRLVISVARRYIGRGLSFEDLIQEGNIGLLTAVRKYDYTRNYKFSTYAINWIKQAITRAIYDKSKTIRVPVRMRLWMDRVTKTREEYLQKNAVYPTDEELAKILDVSKEKVEDILKYYVEPTSLFTTLKDDSDTELGDMIPDVNVSVEDEAMLSDMQRDVRALINKVPLTDRERMIIYYRFGFVDGKPYTLEEVGTFYGVSRERIRQIEAKALRKFINYRDMKKYCEYMDDPQSCEKAIDRARSLYGTRKFIGGNAMSFIYEDQKKGDAIVVKAETKSLMEYFKNDFSYDELINIVMFYMDKSDREVIFRIYGEDLKGVDVREVSSSDRLTFSQDIVKRMKSKLASLYGKERFINSCSKKTGTKAKTVKKSYANLITYFNSEYTYDELIYAISNVDSIEMENLIYSYCGKHLDGVDTKELSKLEKSLLYTSVFVKLKARLVKLYGKDRFEKANAREEIITDVKTDVQEKEETDSSKVVVIPRAKVSVVTKKVVSDDTVKIINDETVSVGTKEEVSTESISNVTIAENNTLVSADYKGIKELILAIQTDQLKDIGFSNEEIMVCTLLHGFRGKSYTISQIAEFLQEDEECIKEIARNSVKKYQKTINDMFDNYLLTLN